MTDRKNCNNCKHGRHLDEKGEIIQDKIFCHFTTIAQEKVAPEVFSCSHWEFDHSS